MLIVGQAWKVWQAPRARPNLRAVQKLLDHAWVTTAQRYTHLEVEDLQTQVADLPAVYQSGDKDARGPLAKAGNRWLRYAAVLAAQRIGQMKEPDPRLKRVFLSVAVRHGRNPGKIAAARRLLDLIYYMPKKEEDYRAPRVREAAA